MNKNITKCKVNKIVIEMLLCVVFVLLPMYTSARSWTLKDCIEYAITNNITKSKLTQQKELTKNAFLK